MQSTLENTKLVQVIPPQAIVNNASFTCTEVDTLGYDFAEWHFVLGATDIAFTALKMQESDTTGSGFADVTGLIYGTSALPVCDGGATSALPSATDDNKFFVITVDVRGPRKRFFKPVVTIGNGSTGGFIACECILGRSQTAPVTKGDRNLAAQLRV